MIGRTNVSESVASEPSDGRGRSLRLVPFLFGVALAAGRTELPGAALVTLLGDLGLTGSAARGLLARMKRDGQLAGTRRGRTVDYRLAGPFAEAFHRIRAGAVGADWQGHFHAVLYQVPERHRPFRDQLRRAGIFAGYGLLQQGVLISPSDRRDRLTATLEKAPAAAQVHFGTLQMAIDDARRAAATAWDLAALEHTYRGHLTTLRRALARRSTPPPSGTTLRRFADTTSAILVDTLRASGLPPQLAPDQWSLPELRHVIEEFEKMYLAASVRYLRDVLPATAPTSYGHGAG
jgi:phenylacetic acid degradation operon negative regulatory protein